MYSILYTIYSTLKIKMEIEHNVEQLLRFFLQNYKTQNIWLSYQITIFISVHIYYIHVRPILLKYKRSITLDEIPSSFQDTFINKNPAAVTISKTYTLRHPVELLSRSKIFLSIEDLHLWDFQTPISYNN